MSAGMDAARRFGGVSRLYGAKGLAKLKAAHICVIGIGGVGSWAAEALARNAVGAITLIDLDNIAESNVNRQLHAVDGAFGKAKVTAMAERIRLINPSASVNEIEDFVTIENVSSTLNQSFDGVIDCIDDAKAKAAIANFCMANSIPLVMTGAAGGRLDATRIKQADLSQVSHDKLLAKVRNLLRRDYGFNNGHSTKGKSPKLDIQCVYSDEDVIKPDSACEVSETAMTGLNCAGYGSSVCVTAPFGFVAAGLLLQQILND
ncbi:MAG: tRNA threonylcarbamoyladenosine dehydratase [Methylotenera sp.]|nr:tRNA threonylcarbamoyladenosine dehydratase [Methylotenera sp.]MDO9205962.1 tRNA threonylcarbamoyladenosine dehydratase [Methylotenera sp.]MDP1522256.1 tRNA threonylcarbamoyladenosine dehydratase [Methylotenera sp.]MDP2231176.1 tRNA threonylcarbamoyladenosine dehydratase [Methylotenera sp.]MDP3140503.1 tRNA threonylcarbamoyladenosine dehydratase [Methylotenera sp.]